MAATSVSVSTASGGKSSGTVGDWCWTGASLLVAIVFGNKITVWVRVLGTCSVVLIMLIGGIFLSTNITR